VLRSAAKTRVNLGTSQGVSEARDLIRDIIIETPSMLDYGTVCKAFWFPWPNITLARVSGVFSEQRRALFMGIPRCTGYTRVLWNAAPLKARSKPLIIPPLGIPTDNDENVAYFVLPVTIIVGYFMLFTRARYRTLADGRHSHSRGAKMDYHDALYYMIQNEDWILNKYLNFGQWPRTLYALILRSQGMILKPSIACDSARPLLRNWGRA
jgi:hypothetical protein